MFLALKNNSQFVVRFNFWSRASEFESYFINCSVFSTVVRMSEIITSVFCQTLSQQFQTLVRVFHDFLHTEHNNNDEGVGATCVVSGLKTIFDIITNIWELFLLMISVVGVTSMGHGVQWFILTTFWYLWLTIWFIVDICSFVNIKIRSDSLT